MATLENQPGYDIMINNDSYSFLIFLANKYQGIPSAFLACLNEVLHEKGLSNHGFLIEKDFSNTKIIIDFFRWIETFDKKQRNALRRRIENRPNFRPELVTRVKGLGLPYLSKMNVLVSENGTEKRFPVKQIYNETILPVDLYKNTTKGKVEPLATSFFAITNAAKLGLDQIPYIQVCLYEDIPDPEIVDVETRDLFEAVVAAVFLGQGTTSAQMELFSSVIINEIRKQQMEFVIDR